MAKILLIDDELDALNVLKNLLHHTGHDIIMACGGDEGLAKAKQDMPDVILLDILMPDMNGHEVIKKLKKNKITKAIPVIMISAREDARLGPITLSKEEGAVEYITKPIQLEILLSVITRALGVK